MLRFVLAVVVAVAGCATVHPKQAPVDVDGGGRNVCAELGCNDDRASFKDECVQAGCAPAAQTLYPEPAKPVPLPGRAARVDLDKPELIAWQMPLEVTEHAAARVPLDVAQQVPALGGSGKSAPSWTQNCTGSAAKIDRPTGIKGYVSILVWNNSSTPIYLGASDVSSSGMPYCTAAATCPMSFESFDVTNLWCITGGGTVPIIVQVISEAAP